MSDDTGDGRRRCTALRGVPFALTFAQTRAPGTAPSRLNAKIIREVEVMQAVEQ